MKLKKRRRDDVEKRILFMNRTDENIKNWNIFTLSFEWFEFISNDENKTKMLMKDICFNTASHGKMEKTKEEASDKE